jgi:hypothetical protein
MMDRDNAARRPDPPSDEELDAFLEAIYEARDRDRDDRA